MDYLEATYREVAVAYLNVSSEFVRGDKNAYEIRQHGGWVACGMDISFVCAERRRIM
jgi:hypothetical protein